ncbi:MAG: hypothetical protein IJQ38_02915 [Bacteroidaceae bacterium]|nr:hypothetical protein [Bacteroidaceae bacterium]
MNLPKDFEKYFLCHWKEEDVAALVRGLDAEAATSIRLNPKRLPPDAEPAGADGRVPWCQEGVYLKERPVFTADPLLHAGAYYVQEASSMFLAHVLRTLRPAPRLALDLCAAPGGKSTLLRSLLPDDCLLVSNEPNRARCQVLAENMAKWGSPQVLVTQAYAADLADAVRNAQLTIPDCARPAHAQFSVPDCGRTAQPLPSSSFGLILADVPCSGEGMMRKEAEAVAQWSPAFVAECAALQRSIISDIWPALQPGGLLIYSTCTFNPEEDEGNVEWIARELGADVLPIPVDPSWNIREDLRNHQNRPLQQHQENEAAENEAQKNEAPNNEAAENEAKKNEAAVADGSPSVLPSPLPCYHFLPGQIRGEGFFLAVLRKHGGTEAMAPDSLSAEEIPSSQKEKKAKKTKKKARQQAAPAFPILPTDQLDHEGAPLVELSLANSIRYLQREALVLPPDTPRGIVQVCYCGQRLGLMNNLGNRANNLYPKEWRIRSTYISPASLFDADKE